MESVIKCTLDLVVNGQRPLDLLVWSALLDRLARHIEPFDGKPHVGLFETRQENLLQPRATSGTFETLLLSVDSFVRSEPLLYDGP